MSVISIIRTTLILLVGICLVFMSISTRLNNPGLTETQLFLVNWKEYAVGVILMLLIAIVLTILEGALSKWFNNRR